MCHSTSKSDLPKSSEPTLQNSSKDTMPSKPKLYDGKCTGNCVIVGFLTEHCETCGWDDGWMPDGLLNN